MKLKKKFIGQKTFSNILNKMVEISEDSANILLKDGRFDLFEMITKKPVKSKLKPKIKKIEVKEEEKEEEKS